MPKIKSEELSVRKVRENLSEVLGEAVRGRITYVTSHGRRIAAIVPLVDAEAIDTAEQGTPPQEPAPASS